MTKYRVTGVPAAGTPAADLIGGRGAGEEFDGDFSEEQERSAAGAGVIERVEGDTLQPEVTGGGAETMDAPPHTAEPGVGYQDVPDEVVGENPQAHREAQAEQQPEQSAEGEQPEQDATSPPYEY